MFRDGKFWGLKLQMMENLLIFYEAVQKWRQKHFPTSPLIPYLSQNYPYMEHLTALDQNVGCHLWTTSGESEAGMFHIFRSFPINLPVGYLRGHS